ERTRSYIRRLSGAAVSSFPSSLRSSLKELTAFYYKSKKYFNLLLQFSQEKNIYYLLKVKNSVFTQQLCCKQLTFVFYEKNGNIKTALCRKKQSAVFV
ncbi:MAG: hypothetical protein VZR27_01415, partial [Acutalibacteraceae bacterium]|nr:hypothetical protein [Acutalibacteraceae bacterium]